MPFGFDSVSCGNQLQLGSNEELFLSGIRGSGDLQGPIVIGQNNTFPGFVATLMVGPLSNPDAPPMPIPGGLCDGINHSPYSLAIVGDAVIMDNLDVNLSLNVGVDVTAVGDIEAFCGAHKLSLKKNFDIPHPNKDGWRLRHTCLEGPANDVYFRGRLTSSNHINIPEYWKNFVNPDSITVSLTEIGYKQNLVVSTFDIESVKIRSMCGANIDCFYLIHATRSDGEDLIVEYEGDTPGDYPGNSDEYSIVGWNYDNKR